MEALLISLVWAAIAYFYAKSVKEQHPDIDVNPDNYILGGILFGVFSVLWCAWKHFRFKK